MQWRVVFRGPAGRIAETAARAVARRQASGVIPPEMMTAPEISVEISLVPATGATGTKEPIRPAIAILSAARRARAEVASTALQWSLVDAGGRRVASAMFRRADLPSEFDVMLREAEGGAAAWSCSLGRDDVARIQ